MASPDEPLTEQERATSFLVARLRADGDTAPVIALLQGGVEGPERVRDALTILAELDLELVVQVALDALIQAHVDDPGTARQTRKVMRDAG